MPYVWSTFLRMPKAQDHNLILCKHKTSLTLSVFAVFCYTVWHAKGTVSLKLYQYSDPSPWQLCRTLKIGMSVLNVGTMHRSHTIIIMHDTGIFWRLPSDHFCHLLIMHVLMQSEHLSFGRPFLSPLDNACSDAVWTPSLWQTIFVTSW